MEILRRYSRFASLAPQNDMGCTLGRECLLADFEAGFLIGEKSRPSSFQLILGADSL